MHKSICLIARSFQRCTQPPPANSSASQTLFLCPFSVDTTAVNHSDPTPASPIERDDNEVDAKESKDNTKDSVWYVIYALGLFSFAHWNVAIAGKVYMMKWLTIPSLWLDAVPRNRHYPQIPSRQSGQHHLFLLVLPVPKGNSSRTEALIVTRSIPRERNLNFRVSSTLP